MAGARQASGPWTALLVPINRKYARLVWPFPHVHVHISLRECVGTEVVWAVLTSIHLSVSETILSLPPNSLKKNKHIVDCQQMYM